MIKPSAMRGFPSELESNAQESLRRLAGWLVLAGLGLRLFHYLRNYTIWYDESVLLFNILDKDYARLVGPLDYDQAAPPLFLWSLRFLWTTFGDHPYLWRFVPFVGSCLLLLLTYQFARRFLSPLAGVALVGLVTFSNAHVWLGCNVKPYIFDALIGAGLIFLYFATDNWTLPKRLLLFALLAPALLMFSYPAIFLYGGVSLAFGPAVLRARSPKVFAAYILLALVLACTFAALAFGPMKSQHSAELAAMWANKCPNWQRPWSVPGWIVGNFLLVCHYCYNPVGAGCVGLAILGAIACRRANRSDLNLLLAGPILLCLLASCLQRYPFSNNRLIFFLAPALGMLIALGVPRAVTWLERWTPHARRLLLVAIILPQAAYASFNIVKPWDHPNSSAVAALIRRDRQPGDLVASDEPGYRYFFMDEFKTLSEMAAAVVPSGQRVWVPVDYYSPKERRDSVQRFLNPIAWEIRAEIQLHEASVFLLVKR